MKIEITKIKLSKEEIDQISFINNIGFEVKLLSLGASIYSISMLNKNNERIFVSEACKDYESFAYTNACFGKTVGPVAGRIDKAHAFIDGKEFIFEQNNNDNSLHSGSANIAYKNFKYQILQNEDFIEVTFTYSENKAFLGGFPSLIDYKITYIILANTNDIEIKFEAFPREKCLLNLTNHIYLNLNGGLKPIYDHSLYIRDSKVAELDDGLIIKGFKKPEPYLDFSISKNLEASILNETLLKHPCHGIDHPFLFLDEDFVSPCCILYSPISDITMTMYTTCPAVVIYTDNYPDGLENQSGVKDTGNFGITFESVTPTNDISKITYDKDYHFKQVTRYSFK